MKPTGVLGVLVLFGLAGCVTITEVGNRPISCSSNSVECHQELRVNFTHALLTVAPSASATFSTSGILSGTYSETIDLEQDDGSNPPTSYQYDANWAGLRPHAWCPRKVDYVARGRFLGIFPGSDEQSINIAGVVERVLITTDTFASWESQVLPSSTVIAQGLTADKFVGIWSAYDNTFTINSATLTCGGQDCSTISNPPIINIQLGGVPAAMACGALFTAQFECTKAGKDASAIGELRLNTTQGTFGVDFMCAEPLGA